VSRMIPHDLRHFIAKLEGRRNHPPRGPESFLWSTRIDPAVSHYRLMPLRDRRFPLKFVLALLAVLIVLVARFKTITAPRTKTAPMDSSGCDSRIIILVDDSMRDGVTPWSKNEGASERYVLDGSKINCNSQGKRRKQLEKEMAPRPLMFFTWVSDAGLTIGGEPGVGVIRMIAGKADGVRLLSVAKGWPN
jgi:hypothetical protein